ncbi:MAG TPA: ABC transporter permease subunit [Terriglobales bacterium]|nr:ABC transporter permease subunit [Terriglobales bacterium]
MSSMLAIMRKEWQTYFITPAAWVVMALFALISAFFFYSMLAVFVLQGMNAGEFGGGNLNVNTQVLGPLSFDIGITLLFLLPMVTMRLYSEETRSGTMELLRTSPIRRLDIILGKFLASFGLLVILLIITGLYVAVVAHYGAPDLRAIGASFLGLALLGGAFLSIGLLISSFTKNQIVAGVITFVLFLLLWVADWVTAYGSGVASHVVAYMSVTAHLQNFTQGIIDLKDVIFYLSLIVAGLFLTARRMELAE